MSASNVVEPDFFRGQRHTGEAASATAAREAAFAEFWKWYPLKKARPKAMALFMAITGPGGYETKTLNKDSGSYIPIHLAATPDEIIEGAKRFWKSLPAVSATSYKRDTSFCPHPATWLNQGRWSDLDDE